MKLSRISLFAFLLAACAAKDETPKFSEQEFESHVKVLASDDFGGRMPFSEGETKTIAYLEEQFKKIGLEPGNGDSYLQEVPMVKITATTDPEMIVKGTSKGAKELLLKGHDDYVLWTERTEPSIEFKDDEFVFAGFGAVAPEYNWNDYEGIDVKGKIVLVLVNDPGFGSIDTTFFKGSTMTYYGRWTYKFEEAARQGAKGCLVIHNTIPAGYPFNVPQNGWNAPHLYLDNKDDQSYRCAGIGWISMPATEKLFEAAGLNFNELQTKARQPGFRAMPMGIKGTVGMTVTATYAKSYNVVGKITGSTAPNEFLIYSAHWDHIGVGKADESGDNINNGAEDNASGTAGMLELARVFKAGKPTNRTLIFLAVTAEEQGLQGSAYYCQHPIYDPAQTAANINIDGLGSYGAMKDIVVIGNGQSDLEDLLSAEAKTAGRYVAREPNPVAGYYFRSDHFNFAKVGIPALFTATGIDHVEKGKEYGKQLQDEFVVKHYHQPSDEYDSATWKSDGAVADLTLLYQVGKRVANSTEWPQWKPNSEFRSIRKKDSVE